MGEKREVSARRVMLVEDILVALRMATREEVLRVLKIAESCNTSGSWMRNIMNRMR